MIEQIEQFIERLKAIAGNFIEFFGGVAAPSIIGLFAALVVAVIVVAANRLRPRRRIGYAMIPDPKFDPSIEEIIRWSAGLAEARAAIGFGTDSHRMVRLTFCSDDQGNLVSLVGMNPRARSVAERNGYSGVDLGAPTETLGDLAPSWLPPAPPATPASTAGPATEPVPAEEPRSSTPADSAQDNIDDDQRHHGDPALLPLVAAGGSRWENVL